MQGQDFQLGTSESVKKTMDNMRRPFVTLIETDNDFLDDYDRTHNMGDLLIKIGRQMKADGNESRLIRDPNGNVIGRFDWH